MPRVSVTEAEAMMRKDLSAMRKEYTKMRDIAQKRIKRLGESEFSWSQAYKQNRNGFKKLKELDIRDLPKAFSELSKFVSAKGSSVSGQKEIRNKTIATWNKQGIPLNKNNYNRTIRILEEMRKRKIVYGSDTAEELARLTLELSDGQFDEVLDNLEAYLLHTGELKDFLDDSYDAETGYQKVDMTEFTNMIGW